MYFDPNEDNKRVISPAVRLMPLQSRTGIRSSLKVTVGTRECIGIFYSPMFSVSARVTGGALTASSLQDDL